MIDRGATVDADLLVGAFIAGNLSGIDLLLEALTDIGPFVTGESSLSDRNDSKLVQLLLDRAENYIDSVLEAVFPHVATYSVSGMLSSELPPAKYRTSTPANAKTNEIRFGKVLPLAVHHGPSWASVLKCLLDKSVHMDNREHYMDTALQCACYYGYTDTLRMLLDWCQDSPLQYRLLPGLGHGLVYLAKGHYSSLYFMAIQRIRDSMLNIPADNFWQAYCCARKPFSSGYFETECQRVFLEWGVERSCRDVDFANRLGFVPTGGAGDLQRLEQHLERRQPPR